MRFPLDARVRRPWNGRGRRSRTPYQSVLWVAAFCLVMLFVWERASVDRLVVRLEKAREVQKDLQTDLSSLSMEADRLSNLVQVETRAKEELGLRCPTPKEIVLLDFDGVPDDHRQFAMGALVPEASAAERGKTGTR